MIAENKNIARSHHFLKEGKWVKRYSNQPFIRDMRKCTVGLVGFGFIGSRVAKRLSGFECRVVVFDPYVDAKEIEAHGVDVADSLESLLEASDFVSLHMRISSDTHHMIDAEALRRMKPTAYLVNTARADLVDEEALVDALRDHRIGGAAIDVYAEEPIGTDHPYLSLDNVTLVSHLAGTSADTMQTSVEIGFEDLEAYLKGEELINRRA
jgi:phosphoglycerate dehydrogenase